MTQINIKIIGEFSINRILTIVEYNSVLNNFKKPLKSKTKDINSQSKANKYTLCIGK